MSLLTRIFEKRSTEQTLLLKDPALIEIFGGGSRTAAGINISENNALKIGAVWACVNAISQDVAKMPLHTYRKTASGREEATSHPVFNLLKTRPNPLMTSMNFREMMQSSLLRWGNAFAEIERDGAGNVTAVWPWMPGKVRLQIFNRALYYYYADLDGVERQFRQGQVLHLRGMGGDGILGYSVISLHRESLGLCEASLEYRSRFFANDARPGGVFQYPGRLSKEAHENLKNDLRQKFTGENQRSFAVLEEGLQWKDIGIPPNDAQYIEGWQANKEDIAGIYRVPPYKIGILKPGTVSHSSVEQAAIDYYADCLLAWVKCWEQACDVALFTEAEQRVYYTKFEPKEILRADSKTQAEVLQIGRRNGVINANEWRELLDMNPIGGEGETYIVEGNMTRLDQVGAQSGPVLKPSPADPAMVVANGNGAGAAQ